MLEYINRDKFVVNIKSLLCDANDRILEERARHLIRIKIVTRYMREQWKNSSVFEYAMNIKQRV